MCFQRKSPDTQTAAACSALTGVSVSVRPNPPSVPGCSTVQLPDPRHCQRTVPPGALLATFIHDPSFWHDNLMPETHRPAILPFQQQSACSQPGADTICEKQGVQRCNRYSRKCVPRSLLCQDGVMSLGRVLLPPTSSYQESCEYLFTLRVQVSWICWGILQKLHWLFIFSFVVSIEATSGLLLLPGAERTGGCVGHTGHTPHTASSPPAAGLVCAAHRDCQHTGKTPVPGCTEWD